MLLAQCYVCGIHFPAGHPDEDNDSPLIFLSKPVISKRYTHISTKGDFHVTTFRPKPHSAADFSTKEHISDVCSVTGEYYQGSGDGYSRLETLLSESWQWWKSLRFLLPNFELPL